MFLYTFSHMSSNFMITGHLMPDDCPQQLNDYPTKEKEKIVEINPFFF